MTQVDGGVIIGRLLKEQGIKYLFAVNGGHIFPILANIRDHGIKLIHMRHEQATAYAADAYARLTRTPGVCAVTAGCGLTNAVTGLCTAALTNSAVVCLSGQHPTTEDDIGSFQEAYGSELVGSFAKYTKRVLDWSTIEIDLRQSFREALNPPQGVSLLEIPTNILYHVDDAAKQRPGAKVYELDELRAQADPRKIEQLAAAFVAAERPLIAGGDGIFWSDASAELRELAELTHTPVYCRRAGQGALDEAHPLAIRGAWKKPFTGSADLVVAIGFRFWSGEKFGQPPTWTDQASYVQIDTDPQRIGWHVPAELGIIGDPKLVMRQLIDFIRIHEIDFAAKQESAWLQQVGTARANFAATIEARAQATHDEVPVHPDRLIKEMTEVIDDDATIIVDSFTLSGYTSQWFTAHQMGQIVDAGPLAPVGHGVGMGIGAQLARPGKQVVVISGDGGLGIGGMDLESAAKYDIPIVCLLWNNSSWGPAFESMPVLAGKTDPFDMLPDIRYDKVFAPMGVHTEHVAGPADVKVALERALASGRPALINVVGDKKYGHPSLGGNLLGSTQL